MKTRILMVLMGLFLCSARAFAQQQTITGRVTNELSSPLAGVSVIVTGTRTGTTTGPDGAYSIRANQGNVLQFRLIGTAPEERTIGTATVINVQLRKVAADLDAIVVTALGQTTSERSLGTAQQTVSGEAIAQTQRENFINALQGRVAGVDVTSSSGVPGASSSIVIRGVSSISGSNQPLMIVDGLPIDNKTLNTNQLTSDAANSVTALSNRQVDFTNRAADINPDDIESLVVLKGPEASALYGIDAANGAIVITTKRGVPGSAGFTYSNAFRTETPGAAPQIQHVYGPQSAPGTSTLLYFGSPYPGSTTFYNNIGNFFQTAQSQTHNLAFSGGAIENKINFRLAGSQVNQSGVVPNSRYTRTNITGASQAQVKDWLNVDLSMQYAYDNNDQTFKGDGGPLIGLLVWPDSNDARNYLTPAGNRLRLTTLGQGAEVDNPYFSVNKNKNNAKTNRLISNLGFIFTPWSWATIRSNIGADTYTDAVQLVRNPESALGFSLNGILDQSNDVVRNLTEQTYFSINRRPVYHGISFTGLVGNEIQDAKSTTDGFEGQNFLDPNFISINNTNTRLNREVISQRRLVSGFGSATLDYANYLFVTATGRNDWTSTIPQGANSFFYPSIQSSFVFSDAFPAIGKHMTGKLRAAYAEVGKDAHPYSYRSALEYKTTTNGGYGYGFYGPNLALKPEFAKSYEVGTEMSFLENRLGLDLAVYRKDTQNQIVNDIRGSYATGFILVNLNGASTRNHGVELTVRGTPVLTRKFSWDFQMNYTNEHGKTLSLPDTLPESYVSDTWLFGNVRNGTAPGLSTMSLTGLFYLRNKNGDILIDPTSGLPIRSTTFIDGGYDRQPKYTVGLTNTLHYSRFTLDFLLDFRRGGDVFNATEQFLTARGLAMSTLDRETPRVVKGVLRDGKENSATPTQNTIVVIPAEQTTYYTNISEELFIEKNINWVRLKDVTLRYAIPERILRAREASIYITGTDLFLRTNYTGLDPLVNGNSAAVGGSGAVGIDYGNFATPRSFNIGVRLAY